MVMMILVVVGTVNLGLVGLGGLLGSNLDVLGRLLGGSAALMNIVYLLIGISGVMVGHAHMTGKCGMK